MGFFFWQRKKQEVILKNENSVAIIIGTREEKKEKRILPNGLVIASSVISFQLHFRLLFNAPFNKRSSTLLSLFFSTFIHDQIIGYVFLMIRFHRDFAWRKSIPFLWDTFLIRDKFISLVVIRLLSCYYICPLLICLIDPRDVLTIVNNHG